MTFTLQTSRLVRLYGLTTTRTCLNAGLHYGEAA
jgi:hypothetical protein